MSNTDHETLVTCLFDIYLATQFRKPNDLIMTFLCRNDELLQRLITLMSTPEVRYHSTLLLDSIASYSDSVDEKLVKLQIIDAINDQIEEIETYRDEEDEFYDVGILIDLAKTLMNGPINVVEQICRSELYPRLI